MNIFNNACNLLYDACNPVITKCVFQIIGETMKQFTLCHEEIESLINQLGTEEIFMKSRTKLTIHDSMENDDSYRFHDEVLIKKDNNYSRPSSQMRTPYEYK